MNDANIVALSTRKYEGKRDTNHLTSYESAACASYITLPTTTGLKGPTPCREGRKRCYNRRNDKPNYRKSPQEDNRKSCQENNYKKSPQELDSRKSLHDRDKGFKPCHLHGEQSNHTYEDFQKIHAIKLHRNCAQQQYNNKHAHDSHHQDNRYLSSEDKLGKNNCTPMPSDNKASASGGSKVANKNYHQSLDGKCPKKERVTFVPRQSHKSDTTKLHKELKESDIEWDDSFDDNYLANFEMGDEDADLKNGINLFAFGN